MDEGALYISALSALIAILTFVLGYFKLRNKASKRDVISVEERLRTLGRDLHQCEIERSRLEGENAELRRRLIGEK